MEGEFGTASELGDQAKGLYDASFEHDACGVGLLCDLNRRARRSIVTDALTILQRLHHRGGCGCDPESGDGAGILVSTPKRFLKRVFPDVDGALIDGEAVFVAQVFLPRAGSPMEQAEQAWLSALERTDMVVLGRRDLPTRSSVLGQIARSNEPRMVQYLVGMASAGTIMEGASGPLSADQQAFLARKRAERAWRGLGLEEAYVASCSRQTVVYKGMLTVDQLGLYFEDLGAADFEAHVAMVHSRFSTNTTPRWSLAQPFRGLCHNGEINTIQGNRQWMQARSSTFGDSPFGEALAEVLPVLSPGVSDSASLDEAYDFLIQTGRVPAHAMRMLIPEAWEHNGTMPAAVRAFYDYHSCLMEPWDGPATVAFTDGRYVGAVLDRNGLRPSRYVVTRDHRLILSSEAGVLDIPPRDQLVQGRLEPGKLLLADLARGEIVTDEAIKQELSSRAPYGTWVAEQLMRMDHLPSVGVPVAMSSTEARMRQNMHGYTQEDLRLLLKPMAQYAKEAIASMGDDTPLAVLSEQPRPLYDYFKQRFAQVTNPPLDAIREALVTSLITNVGGEGSLFEEQPQFARMLRLDQPLLTDHELARIRGYGKAPLKCLTLDATFPAPAQGKSLKQALARLRRDALSGVDQGRGVIILSDRKAGPDRVAIPALLATGAVNQALIEAGKRMRCAIIVESAEPREVHHMATLIGYGATAINPYLALHTVQAFVWEGRVHGIDEQTAVRYYIEAIRSGLLKVMSKMGISTLPSYRGAQVFEALGLSNAVVSAYFKGTPTRIGGLDLDDLAEESRRFHARAFPHHDRRTQPLEPGGRYQWRPGGESHAYNPDVVAHLRKSAQTNDEHAYAEFAQRVNAQTMEGGALRGLLDFKRTTERVTLNRDAVESWQEIVKRFRTGAMSFGSISPEAHTTLARAMNRLGGASNTGEGGEAPARYAPSAPDRSRIKQVASGRFGVTISYLASADEIQIKMAQGAKPGEGGQLPAEKVNPEIARVRHATPYVGLVSPPPHHDIYSIEDLAQLIHDLKRANPRARISVKLVSVAGIGTVAAGVAKAKADHILISGHDGGTGAASAGSIKHAGLPWELGLAEVHQTLVQNGLRDRVRLEVDGQLKTGRDVAIAALLGADEFGFSTAPLIAMGCIMMRKCHLNTCPVGIATQDADLRAHFTGVPEHVVNYFHFVAEEVRTLLSELGLRSVDEAVGATEYLVPRKVEGRWKARKVDLTALCYKAVVPDMFKPFAQRGQNHDLEADLDVALLAGAAPALDDRHPVVLDAHVTNEDRSVGTRLSYEVTRRHGTIGLRDGAIVIRATGTAGQSTGAFLAPGITFDMTGLANDYVGKGLSGGRIVIRPPENVAYRPHENTVVGNVALYGATSGELFVRGRAGERFGVRNSGATAVVEGVGDHACEYMTGGVVVVLGPTGRNFGAGMSGGVAYVLDGTRDFRSGRCNPHTVDLEMVEDPTDIDILRELIASHARWTGSLASRWVLDNWTTALREFVKVMPHEYRRALAQLASAPSAERTSIIRRIPRSPSSTTI